MMPSVYKATLSSNVKELDGVEISIRYPAPIEVGMKLQTVEPLHKGATEHEQNWYKEQVLPHIIKES
jgi:hypothetical protein